MSTPEERVTLLKAENQRLEQYAKGIGDAKQTYVSAGDIFGEFQSRFPALTSNTCGFRHRRGCEEFSALGSRCRAPRKPVGMRLPPGEEVCGRTGDVLGYF
jgi:hypothetical protein